MLQVLLLFDSVMQSGVYSKLISARLIFPSVRGPLLLVWLWAVTFDALPSQLIRLMVVLLLRKIFFGRSITCLKVPIWAVQERQPLRLSIGPPRRLRQLLFFPVLAAWLANRVAVKS